MANTMEELYRELYYWEKSTKFKDVYWFNLPITPPSKGHPLYETITKVIEEIWQLTNTFSCNRSKKIVRHGIKFDFTKFNNYLPAYIMRRSGIPYIKTYKGSDISQHQASKVLELMVATWQSQMRKVAQGDPDTFKLTQDDTILSNVGWQQSQKKYDYLEVCLKKDPLEMSLQQIVKMLIHTTAKELFSTSSFPLPLPLPPQLPPPPPPPPRITLPQPPAELQSVPPLSESSTPKKYVRCDICFHQHKALILKRKPYELVIHYQEYHPTIPMAEIAYSTLAYTAYPCSCGTQFATYRGVYDHQRTVHYDIYPFSTYKETQYRRKTSSSSSSSYLSTSTSTSSSSSSTSQSTSTLFNDLEERRVIHNLYQEALPLLFDETDLDSSSSTSSNSSFNKKRTTMEEIDDDISISLSPSKVSRTTKELSDAIWPVFQEKFASLLPRREIDIPSPPLDIDTFNYLVLQDAPIPKTFDALKIYLERKKLVPEGTRLGIQDYVMTVVLNAYRGDIVCREFVKKSISEINSSLDVTLSSQTILDDEIKCSTYNRIFKLLIISIANIIAAASKALF